MQPSDYKKQQNFSGIENEFAAPCADAVRIVVSIANQSLVVSSLCGKVLNRYPISTSRFGVGFQEGSYRTPVGRFRIAEKIGDSEPAGMVFKARKPTGEFGLESDPRDLVLTRILWLEGLDTANDNTQERYIYIHGTNHEASIGEPASMGCVRMRNRDMLELFERVERGVEVWIV